VSLVTLQSVRITVRAHGAARKGIERFMVALTRYGWRVRRARGTELRRTRIA